MLPTMQPVEASRTRRARATKAFEAVRIGKTRLYFSHFELIGFQLDGMPPVVVCVPLKLIGVYAGVDLELHRLHLEPDKEKWCSKNEFERKWEELEAAVLR
jgi:hypothetical protein